MVITARKNQPILLLFLLITFLFAKIISARKKVALADGKNMYILPIKPKNKNTTKIGVALGFLICEPNTKKTSNANNTEAKILFFINYK